MAQAVPLLGVAFQVIGQMRQASAQDRAAEQQAAAAEEAERIATMNAAATEAETAEAVRREREAASDARGQRRLAAAAAGGELSGSTAAYLDTQARREDEYIGWLQRSGASRAAIERAEGGYARQRGTIAAQATRDRASATRWDAIGSGAKAGFGALYDVYSGGGGGSMDLSDPSRGYDWYS